MRETGFEHKIIFSKLSTFTRFDKEKRETGVKKGIIKRKSRSFELREVI